MKDARVAMNAGRDDAALSSAPTPVRDSPGASALRLARGGSNNGSGRKSQPGVPARTSLLQGQSDKSNDLASALPRRFSGQKYPSGGAVHRPLASRSVGGLPMMVNDKPASTAPHENSEAQPRDTLGDQRRSIGGPLLSRVPRASPSQTPEKSPFTSPINSPATGGLLSLGVAYPAIPQHNLFWASVRQEPSMTTNEHWFSTDRVLVPPRSCSPYFSYVPRHAPTLITSYHSAALPTAHPPHAPTCPTSHQPRQFIPPTTPRLTSPPPLISPKAILATLAETRGTPFQVYSAFCADFGPMNLSCIHRFLKILREKLEAPELKVSPSPAPHPRLITSHQDLQPRMSAHRLPNLAQPPQGARGAAPWVWCLQRAGARVQVYDISRPVSRA